MLLLVSSNTFVKLKQTSTKFKVNHVKSTRILQLDLFFIKNYQHKEVGKKGTSIKILTRVTRKCIGPPVPPSSSTFFMEKRMRTF